MELMSDTEVYQDYALQIMSLIKSLVKEEDARLTILESVFLHFEERNKKVKFTDEKTIAIYLRLLARRFCSNFLQSTCKK